MQNFIRNLIFFSALLGGLIFCWNQISPPEYKTNLLWYLLVFFNGISMLAHFFLFRSSKSSKQTDFVKAFILGTALKLFVYIITILVFCVLYRHMAVKFILSFLALYVPFLIFEVVSLMAISGNKNQSTKL